MENVHHTTLDKQYWEKGIAYADYRSLMENLLAQKKTTGPNQSEAMVAYTKMNAQRMHRLDKTIQLLPETIETLTHISKPMHWLVITEAWCGDAAQNLPALAAMAAQ